MPIVANYSIKDYQANCERKKKSSNIGWIKAAPNGKLKNFYTGMVGKKTKPLFN